MKTLTILLLVSIISNHAFARLASMPNFETLNKADIILAVKETDITYKESDENTEVQISKAITVRGRTPLSSFAFDRQILPIPKSAKISLYYLHNESGKMSLQNQSCSLLPFSSNIEFIEGCAQSKEKMIELLQNAFLNELDPECALLQSYFLSPTFDKSNVGLEYWRRLSAIVSLNRNAYVTLSYINVGIHAIGAECLKSFSDEQLKLVSSLKQGAGESFYANQVRSSIITWVYNNASMYNASALLGFVLLQQGQAKADMLTALSSYCSIQNVQSVITVLKSDQDVMVQYGCMQCLKHIFKDPKGIPTVEEFKKSKESFLNDCIQLLKTHGFPFQGI